MNDVMKAVIDKFNEKSGNQLARLISDDGDSFRVEFSEEARIKEFHDFVKKATKKSVIVQPIENIFGSGCLARIFFEKPVADEIIAIFEKYDSGAPVRGVESCSDGCNSRE